jgi:hypothetical protein
LLVVIYQIALALLPRIYISLDANSETLVARMLNQSTLLRRASAGYSEHCKSYEMAKQTFLKLKKRKSKNLKI